jgi:hypothetical protein
LGFGQLVAIVSVNQQALLLDDFLDEKFLAGVRSDGVAGSKAHALQRRLVNGVNAHFARSFELDLHTTISGLHDRAQPELWLRFADPPLTWNEHTHEMAAAYMRVLPGECNF